MEYKLITQRQKKTIDPSYINDLSERFGISLLTTTYLAYKEFRTYEDIEAYLYPSLENISSPFSYLNMQKVIDRIREAIDKKQCILIYGDYDCDGICATYILYRAIKANRGIVAYYIPDRFEEGYGLSINSAERIIKIDPDLVITVDNGITAKKEIAYLKEHGIDVIVTDHHNPPDELPDDVLIIDGKCTDETYPYKELCGAGVALRVSEALGISDELYDELMVFAGVATVADIVPLTGENRIYVSKTVRKIKSCRNLGLQQLLKVSGINDGDINSGTISFQIAPRINAIGRLSRASRALDLFLAENVSEAQSIAQELEQNNVYRKDIEDEIINKAREVIEKDNYLDRYQVLFIYVENAHEGVLGIAAGKIAETYNRPSIVLTNSLTGIKGSARSIPGFNIYEALKSADDLYEKFGGHEQAAGLTIKEGELENVIERVNEYARKTGLASLLIKKYYYDAEVSQGMLTEQAIYELREFAPFGMDNPKPVFMMQGVSIRNIRVVGKTGKHVSFNVIKGSGNYPVIAYNKAEEITKLPTDVLYDITFTADMHLFRGIASLQLELKAIDMHVTVPSEYHMALYDHFNVNQSGDKGLDVSDRLEDAEPESVLDEKDCVFVLYGKDMFVRINKYALCTGKKLNICYGSFSDHDETALNILVDPVTEDLSYIDKKLIVLDSPCFCGYEKRFYEGRDDVRFIRCDRYIPDIYIDRSYVVFIYKKLPLIENISGSLSRFCEYLNSLSDVQVNYFSLRICLDILSDMDIIDYVVKGDKLAVYPQKIKGTKDINKASTMMKLRDAYL